MRRNDVFLVWVERNSTNAVWVKKMRKMVRNEMSLEWVRINGMEWKEKYGILWQEAIYTHKKKTRLLLRIWGKKSTSSIIPFACQRVRVVGILNSKGLFFSLGNRS